MSRESIVFIVGFLIVLLPHLGLPSVYKLYAYTGLGVFLMLVGYLLRRAAYLRSIERDNGERATDSFLEQPGTTKTREELTEAL